MYEQICGGESVWNKHAPAKQACTRHTSVGSGRVNVSYEISRLRRIIIITSKSGNKINKLLFVPIILLLLRWIPTVWFGSPFRSTRTVSFTYLSRQYVVSECPLLERRIILINRASSMVLNSMRFREHVR